MSSGLTSQQVGHIETVPSFKVSSERPENGEFDPATPGLEVLVAYFEHTYSIFMFV